MKRCDHRANDGRAISRRDTVWRTAAFYVTLSALAAIYLAPAFVLVVGSFKPDELVFTQAGSLQAFVPQQATLQNYRDVFRRVAFARFLFNSVFITASAVTAGLLVNSIAGYAFARLRWSGRDALFGLVLALMIIPFEAIAVPLFYLVTWFGWRETYLVQIIPFVANAFSIYLFYTFFLGMPRQLEEAARVDGAGTVRIFLSIIVPNARPVFATVGVLNFLMIWGMFLWPRMVAVSAGVRPLPVAIAEFQTLPPLQWGDILAFGVMMVAPVLLLFLALQRWFVRGVASAGLKG